MNKQQQNLPMADSSKQETEIQVKSNSDSKFEVVRVSNPWDFAINPTPGNK